MSLLEALGLRRPSPGLPGAETGAEWPLLGEEPEAWCDPYRRTVWLVRTYAGSRTHAVGLYGGERRLACERAGRALEARDRLRLGIMARVDCCDCRACLGLDTWDEMRAS